MIPALSDAANDTALRGGPLTLYLWLLFRLDVQDMRPVPIKETARTLELHRGTVASALRLLVDRGYLERRFIVHRGYRYRLRFTRISPEVLQNRHAS